MEKALTEGSNAVNISSLCRTVGMSRQNWYRERKARERRQIDEELVVKLVKDERKLQNRMGGRKLHGVLKPALDDAGIQVGRDRLFDVLRRHNLLVPRLPRSSRTTNSHHSLPVFRNLVKNLNTTAANQVWVSDITYIRVGRGDFVYLTLIMDRHSRKIVGYHCGDSLETLGCIKALEMAIKELPENEKPIHHSDRGCQYCSHKYVSALNDRDLPVSMTETDHCAENAHAERLNGILKQEYALGMTFKDLNHARCVVDQAVWLYNHRRPHTSLKMKVPAAVHRQAA